jgi:hypothetical protein
VSEEGGLVILSFNLPFPLEAIFCLPLSTYVLAKLARVTMKEGSIFSLKESQGWGCYLLDS